MDEERLRKHLWELRRRGRAVAKKARDGARQFYEEPALRKYWRNQLIRPYRVQRFAAFGKGAVIDRPYWLYGTHKMELADRVAIGLGSWLAVERPAWDKPGPILRMGFFSGARGWLTISASESIVIEDHVGMGSFCSIVDSNHTFDPEAGNVYRSPVTTAPIHIGAGTWFGDRVAVMAGTTIGKGCFIGANSVVRGNIPDYSIVVGMPARVVGSTLG